ncbi:hypothetical protein C8J56DRAFT_1042970 [Mycena floridula]|nr:hypothetical protein C8J56DRAFT_1042970 [Mycena floridula]
MPRLRTNAIRDAFAIAANWTVPNCFLTCQETADFIEILSEASNSIRSLFEKDQDAIKILEIISANSAPSDHELGYEPGIRLVPKIMEKFGSIEKSLRELVQSPTDWNDEDEDSMSISWTLRRFLTPFGQDNEGNNLSKRVAPEPIQKCIDWCHDHIITLKSIKENPTKKKLRLSRTNGAQQQGELSIRNKPRSSRATPQRDPAQEDSRLSHSTPWQLSHGLKKLETVLNEMQDFHKMIDAMSIQVHLAPAPGSGAGL